MNITRLSALCSALTAAACTTLSHTNKPLVQPPSLVATQIASVGTPAESAATPLGSAVPAPPAEAPRPVRATFQVDGNRGNERVLFFLALSGGGLRAAYLSAATMLKLQTLYEDTDLLGEVDVLSSVSGGSMAAAYYAVTRDEVLPLAAGLAPLRAAPPAALPSPKLRVDAAAGNLRCAAPLDADEETRLWALLAPAETKAADARAADAAVRGKANDAALRERTSNAALRARANDAERVISLCAQAAHAELRGWDDASVRQAMTRDYLTRWFGNWFWPPNIARYWFTAYDRADIMAQTLADNLYDSRVLGRDLTFADLNRQRPQLIINATSATEQITEGDPLPEPFSFGSVFTFTDEDFRVRLNSDIASYSVARAVMASSAFPLVFPIMSLRDYRPDLLDICRGGSTPQAVSSHSDVCRQQRFLHLFDGGNSDNLGLRSIKRALFELAVDDRVQEYDKIVVLLVDAFTKPRGARRTDADPRTFLSFVLDTNVIDAVDVLLQTNRSRQVGEFQAARLRWNEGECDHEARNLPPALCAKLDEKFGRTRGLDLRTRLVFYHFGFDDVVPLDYDLKRALDRIPTSFRIDDDEVTTIDRAVDLVLTRDNKCLLQLRAIARGERVSAQQAHEICRRIDVVPQPPPASN